MGKVFGLILMVVAIYVGLTYYTEGMDEATPGEPAAIANEPARAAAPSGNASSSRRPSIAGSRRPPITQRVRTRVQSAVDEGARRHAGDN